MLEQRDAAVMGTVRTAQALLRVRAQLTAQVQQGHHLLACARYKLGTERVCKSQLPAEESQHEASVLVELDGGRRVLQPVEPAPKDPIRLFGLLLPQEMRQAQQAFRKAASMAVEAANLQEELEGFRKQLECKEADKEE